MSTQIDFGPREEAITILFCVVLVPLYIGVLCVFYARRNLQPIKARSPLLLLTSAVAGLLLLVYMELRTAISAVIPCPTTYYVSIFFFILYFVPWLMRCYRLYRVFDFNVAKASIGIDTGKGEDKEFQRVIDKRATLTEPYLLRMLAILMIGVVFFLAVLNGGLSQSYLKIGTLTCQTTERWLVLSISALMEIMVFMFIFLVYKMKHVSDAFSINNELKIICVIASLHVSINLGFMSNNNYAWPKQPYIGYITGSLVLCGLFVSVCWPLYRSFRPSSARSDLNPAAAANGSYALPRRNPDYSTFTEFLRDPEARKWFQEFLINEFSVENVLFWSDVQRYRAVSLAHSDEERRHSAQEMIDKYVLNNSPFQLNLSAMTSNEVRENMAQHHVPPPDLFNGAENEVMHLMKSDSYPRFLDSPQAAKLLREKQRKARTLKAASAANLV